MFLEEVFFKGFKNGKLDSSEELSFDFEMFVLKFSKFMLLFIICGNWNLFFRFFIELWELVFEKVGDELVK